MCGIGGIAGDLWAKEEDTMKRLFLLNFFRGPDSAGLAAVRSNGDVKIAKIASDPITLFQSSKFKEALNGNMSRLFLGHTRLATRGGVNNFNAQPIEVGSIVGVHNGTLENSDKKVLEDVVGESFDVDSQALYACIDKIGVKDTIEMINKGSDDRSGAWALVWYDKKDGTLNFLRNAHRPLWLAWEEGFKRLFFASQHRYIRTACEDISFPYKLAKYERKEYKDEFYTFFSLPEDTHLKFSLEEIKKGSKERPKPISRIIKGKEPKGKAAKYDPFPQYGNNYGKGVGTSSSSKTTSTTPSKISSLPSNKDTADKVFHLLGSDAEPYAGALPYQRFMDLTSEGKMGCSYCFSRLNYGDGGITVYDEEDVILCAECSGYKGATLKTRAKIYLSGTVYDTLASTLKQAA
jgi:predicted glutamine amidotransferase